MKRFWSTASVVDKEGGFTVALDGKPLRLPNGERLCVSSSALASALAEEWQHLGDPFSTDDLPLTRLAGAEINRDETLSQLIRYGMNDLLCYRSETPPELHDLESRTWNPWLSWAAEAYGAHLRTTDDLMPITQHPDCETAFTQALNPLSTDEITGLAIIVPALGSLVLGLAVLSGALSPAAACEAAALHELWQESHWGRDAGAAAKREKCTEAVASATRYVKLCRR